MINTRDDAENFKAMGKVFYRLMGEATTNCFSKLAPADYVRKKMATIYSKYELEEFYANLDRLIAQREKLHQ